MASLGQGPRPRSNLCDGLFKHFGVEGSCNGEEFENCLEGSSALEVLFQCAVFGGNARLERVTESLKVVGATRKDDGARAVDDGKGERLGVQGLGNHRAGKAAYRQHRGRIPKLRRAEANAQGLRRATDEDSESKDVGDALVIAGDPRARNLGTQDALGVTQEHGRARVNVELGCVQVSKRTELCEGNPGNRHRRRGVGGQIGGIAVHQAIETLQGTGGAGEQICGDRSEKLTHLRVVGAQHLRVRREGQRRRQSRAPRGPLSRKSQCVGSGDFGKKCSHD